MRGADSGERSWHMQYNTVEAEETLHHVQRQYIQSKSAYRAVLDENITERGKRKERSIKRLLGDFGIPEKITM